MPKYKKTQPGKIKISPIYITNQPMIRKKGKHIPDPDVEPTKAFILLQAEYGPKGKIIKHFVENVTASNSKSLDKKVTAFVKTLIKQGAEMMNE